MDAGQRDNKRPGILFRVKDGETGPLLSMFAELATAKEHKETPDALPLIILLFYFLFLAHAEMSGQAG